MSLDRNASTLLRDRRNSQRLQSPDLFTLVSTGGLQFTGTKLSIKLADGSLQTNANGLSVHLVDTSIHTAAGGIGVNLATNSGLVISSGIAVQLADTSLALAAGGLSVNLNTAGGLQTSSGVELKLVDTSLVLAAGGVGVNVNATGGLQVSSGLGVKVANVGLVTSASGLGVNFRTNSGLQLSGGQFVAGFRIESGLPGSPQAGYTWWDSTLTAPRTNLQPSPGFAGTFLVDVAEWSVPVSVTANTTAQTFATDTVAFGANSATYLSITNRTFKVWLHVTFNAASVANTFTFNVLFNTTVIGSFTTSSIALGATQDAVVEILVMTKTTGSSGVVVTSIGVISSTPTAKFTTTSALNLTTAQTLQFSASATSTNAGDSVTIQMGHVTMVY